MATPRKRQPTMDLQPAEDLSAPESYPPDTSSGEWVAVHTPYGLVQMTPEGAARYQAEVEAAYGERQDADTLAQAWDASMGAPTAAPQKQEPQSMNGQPGGTIDPNTMAIIQQYMDEGRLDELFQPFQQEQGVLDQQMALAQQQRQPGRAYNTPSGALFGGLSNAIGNIGGAYQQNKALEAQKALGGRMQKDASGRTAALMEMLQRAKGIDPKTGLMGTAVDDATLASIMGGGM